MVAISFSIFKDKLLSGEKDQTIRPFSEYRWKQLLKAKEEGRKLQIYWKQRTKECEKLFDAEITDLFLLWFVPDKLTAPEPDSDYRHFLTIEEEEELSRRDGFKNSDEMDEWFFSKYQLLELAPEPFIVIRFRRIDDYAKQ
jgi:hypothetical protein